MHSRQIIFALGLWAALTAPSPSLLALEATTTTNDRASAAAVARFQAEQQASHFAELAVIQAKVDALLACTAKGRFYAPEGDNPDAGGCTSIEVTVIQ